MKSKFTIKAFTLWVQKICVERHQTRVKEANQSGGGNYADDDVVDLVTMDWHDQKMAGLEGAKKQTAQGDILRTYALGKPNAVALAQEIEQQRRSKLLS